MTQATAARRAGEPISVMVVDDSAVVRQVLTALLAAEITSHIGKDMAEGVLRAAGDKARAKR